MGHTLVTRFSENGYEKIRDLLYEAGIYNNNKIPFGRDCEREEANAFLPYHVTIFHWAKWEDEKYLRALENLRFRPCKVFVTGVSRMNAEEGSSLLYFAVDPGDGYAEMVNVVEALTLSPTSSFLHITLSVGKNEKEIRRQEEALKKASYPFFLDVAGLDLYHIWRPVRLIKTFI